MRSTNENCSEPMEDTVASPWANLPNVVLTKVFSMMNKEDRQSASSVCKNWRANYFQPRWFSSVTFPISPNELEKFKFFTNTFALNVKSACIRLYSLSSDCVREFINLLEVLSRNNNLNSLNINTLLSPTSSPSEDRASSDEFAEAESSLLKVLPKLSSLEICCLKTLSLNARTLVTHLNIPSGVYRDYELDSLTQIIINSRQIILFLVDKAIIYTSEEL